jgi:YihY family inner membrane protein
MTATPRTRTGRSAGTRTQQPPSRFQNEERTLWDGLKSFYMKVNNDWILNFSSLLAYNVLVSFLPVLLVLLAVTSWVLAGTAPDVTAAVQKALSAVLPGDAGGNLIKTLHQRLLSGGDVLFWLGLIASFFIGSRLFITMENCFGIIYRLPSRGLIRQNAMAFAMSLLYLVLVPVVFLASTLSTNIAQALFGSSSMQGFAAWALGIAIAFVSAVLLFGAIYVVVPNREIPWREVWVGTLGASVLLVLYQQIFPFYQQTFLKPNNYGSGSVLGLMVVIVIFFYYVALIILLGAEFNSWAVGLRATPEQIPDLLYDVLVEHREPRGLGYVLREEVDTVEIRER